MSIGVHDVTKRFGALTVLDNLSLEFATGKITCLLGPSGSGKTTLLNVLSGLLPPDEGQVVGVGDLPVSYLFQEPRLLPWKSVRGNFDFVLEKPYPDQAERTQVMAKYLELVGLTAFADYYPSELSGGMKQRAAMARAFAYPSRVLLMDEPFKALDLGLKHSLMNSFLSLWEKDRRTVICVTHDLEEALYLGEHIYVVAGLPARVEHKFVVDLPHHMRKHYDDRLTGLRDSILKLILNSPAGEGSA